MSFMSNLEPLQPKPAACRSGTSRRAVLKGAAWSVPVIAMATSVPLAAASGCVESESAPFTRSYSSENVQQFKNGAIVASVNSADIFDVSDDAGTTQPGITRTTITVTVPDDAVPGTIVLNYGVNANTSALGQPDITNGFDRAQDPDGVNATIYVRTAAAGTSVADAPLLLTGYTRTSPSSTGSRANQDLLETETGTWYDYTVDSQSAVDEIGTELRPGGTYVVYVDWVMDAVPDVSIANDDIRLNGGVSYDRRTC